MAFTHGDHRHSPLAPDQNEINPTKASQMPISRRLMIVFFGIFTAVVMMLWLILIGYGVWRLIESMLT